MIPLKKYAGGLTISLASNETVTVRTRDRVLMTITMAADESEVTVTTVPLTEGATIAGNTGWTP